MALLPAPALTISTRTNRLAILWASLPPRQLCQRNRVTKLFRNNHILRSKMYIEPRLSFWPFQL